MSLYVKDVLWRDPDGGGLLRCDLRVTPGPEGETRMADDGPAPGESPIEGRGALALPGLVCGHHHIYSALARGMPAPPRPPRDFAEMLELVWWRLDKRLDDEMIRASALAAAIDGLRCGVTCFVDHHASPNAIAGSLDLIAASLDEAGLAHVLCLELSDRDGPEAAASGLAETDRYLASGRPGLVGLHASFTVGDALLEAAVDLAERRGTGLHVHVAEDGVDQTRCLADHGCRVVERLAGAGVLERPGTILVHGLHIDDRERGLLRDSEVWLAHNPESNLNNAVGRLSWRGLHPGHVLIGTDGLHGDVLRSARAAYLVGQADGLTPGTAWNLIHNNRRYLRRHHPSASRDNDLVLTDYVPPTPLDDGNLAAHACFGLDARHVRTVVAGGRVVLDEGRIASLDESETLRFCREQARRLWDALERP